MKRLILKTGIFSGLLVLLLILSLFLPPTPRTSESLLFAANKKDSLLANIPSPRIIFVGGSNLSFGLNSQKIKDSLRLNPINTAIHANIGIKYMLENTLQYIHKGDVIVIACEYSHFYNDWDYDSEELLRTIIDVNKSKIKLLSIKQMFNCFQYTGKLILSKFNRFEYVNYDDAKKINWYSVDSFNEFGDVSVHWDLKNWNSGYKPYSAIDITKYNPQVMEKIRYSVHKLQEKGGTVLISYPCFQKTSFNNLQEMIKKIEEDFQASGFTVLGTPERYMMDDSMMFDTPYHLNKTGADYRTQLLIENLKTALIDSLGILK